MVISGESLVGYLRPLSSVHVALGGIVQRQLPRVAEFQYRHRGEALRHRRDAKHRVGVNRRVGS